VRWKKLFRPKKTNSGVSSLPSKEENIFSSVCSRSKETAQEKIDPVPEAIAHPEGPTASSFLKKVEASPRQESKRSKGDQRLGISKKTSVGKAARKRAERLGRRTESLVAFLLILAGWRVEARRVRLSQGELDLVLSRGGEWWIVEVKARRGDRPPFLTRRQQRRLSRAAKAWLDYRKVRNAPIRFSLCWVRWRGILPWLKWVSIPPLLMHRKESR